MKNYELEADEVILFTESVSRDDINGALELTLTSKKMIFEQSKTNKIGLFKSETKIIIIDLIELKDIKQYQGKAQVKQKNVEVSVQTTKNNFTIKFPNALDAMKFVTKVVDAITGTTITERGGEKVKETFNKVDEVLGFDTRDTIKGVIENGIAGSLLKGIKKNKK